MTDETDAERAKAVERARVEAFLAELSELCTRHGMYIDAWATYADDGFFGVELTDSPTAYKLDAYPWPRGSYALDRPHG